MPVFRIIGPLVALVVAVGIKPVAAQSSSGGFDTTAASRLVEEYLRRNGVPGAVVVVTDGARVVLERGFGTASNGAVMTQGTRLPICSVSKSFAALAVMQLVEAGTVSLDTPAVRYLPEFRMADARWTRITVRELLMHRSGMSDRMFREKSVSPVPRSLVDAVAALGTARLASDPGTKRSYHNANYWVLARLVEVVSGKPYRTYLRDNVFVPLGMTQSSVWSSTSDAPDVPIGHIRILNQPIAAREPAWFLDGSCAVVTTAHDLGRWLTFHTTGGSSAPGRSVVSAQSLTTMHEGLGWNSSMEDGHRTITHNGIMFTYSARQYLLPDAGSGMGIAVVTNAGVGLAPLPADEIADMLVKLAEGRPVEQPARTGLIVDAVLLGLSVIGAFLGFRLVVREGRHRGKVRRVWRDVVFVTAALVPVLICALYPGVLRGSLGRDLNWPQSLYVSPMLFALVLVMAAIGLVIATLRVAESVQRRLM